MKITMTSGRHAGINHGRCSVSDSTWEVLTIFINFTSFLTAVQIVQWNYPFCSSCDYHSDKAVNFKSGTADKLGRMKVIYSLIKYWYSNEDTE
jgi:hypothetical protein